MSDDRVKDVQSVANSLEGLLQTQEAQVLGAMGLFVGYICVFFAKILNLTNPYFGVMGVAIITMLLLTLCKTFNWRSPSWWSRSFVIIVICLLITSPQLYFAWTVSVSEAQSAAEGQHQRAINQASATKESPVVTIQNVGSPK